MLRMGRWTELVIAGLLAQRGISDVRRGAHAGKWRRRWVDWHDRQHRKHDERGEQGGSPEPPTV